MKYLPYIMLAAAVCWILSEIPEIIYGTYTSLNLWLTAVFHLLAAIGIWSLHFGQTKGGNNLSFAGTILLSMGYLVLMALPLMILFTTISSPAEGMQTYPFLKFFGLVAMIGTIFFGWSVLKIKYYPGWTALVFIIGSFVTFGVIASQSSMLIANAANIAVSFALLTMAGQVIQDART